jgi:hypothetical protein
VLYDQILNTVDKTLSFRDLNHLSLTLTKYEVAGDRYIQASGLKDLNHSETDSRSTHIGTLD